MCTLLLLLLFFFNKKNIRHFARISRYLISTDRRPPTFEFGSILSWTLFVCFPWKFEEASSFRKMFCFRNVRCSLDFRVKVRTRHQPKLSEIGSPDCATKLRWESSHWPPTQIRRNRDILEITYLEIRSHIRKRVIVTKRAYCRRNEKARIRRISTPQDASFESNGASPRLQKRNFRKVENFVCLHMFVCNNFIFLHMFVYMFCSMFEDSPKSAVRTAPRNFAGISCCRAPLCSCHFRSKAPKRPSQSRILSAQRPKYRRHAVDISSKCRRKVVGISTNCRRNFE